MSSKLVAAMLLVLLAVPLVGTVFFNQPTATFHLLADQQYNTKTGCSPSCAGVSGDTTMPVAWSKAADCAGPFNGGCLFTSLNDGAWPGAPGFTMALLKVTALDMTNVQNTTVNLVNGFQNLNGGGGYCNNTGWVWHGWPIGIRGGIMYWAYGCSEATTDNRGSSGIMCSKDMGATWSGYLSWQSNGNSCPTTGTAAGEQPTTSAGLQWPGSSLTDETQRVTHIAQIQMCQDMTVACPTPAWADPLYDYFFSWKGDLTAFYILRVLKADDLMDPSKYSCVSTFPSTPTAAPAWTSTLTSCTAVPSLAGGTLPYSMMWDGARIVGFTNTGGFGSLWGGQIPTFATAVSPWFGWSTLSVAGSSANHGWDGLALATLVDLGGGHKTFVGMGSGGGGDYSPHFLKFDLQDAAPTQGGNPRAANPGCATGQWRFSKTLSPGAIPSNGLVKFTDISDGCGHTGSGTVTALTDVFDGSTWVCTAGSFLPNGLSNPGCSVTPIGAALNDAWTVVTVAQLISSNPDANVTAQLDPSGGYAQLGWKCGDYGGCSSSSNKVYFRLYNGSQYTTVLQTTSTIASAGGWHVIALAKPAGQLDGNTTTMWVDGVKVATSRAGSPFNGPTDFAANAMVEMTSLGGGGIQAVTGYWNRVLTDQEMGVAGTPGGVGLYKVLKARLAVRGITLP